MKGKLSDRDKSKSNPFNKKNTRVLMYYVQEYEYLGLQV